jgi:hypothetical protein
MKYFWLFALVFTLAGCVAYVPSSPVVAVRPAPSYGYYYPHPYYGYGPWYYRDGWYY